MGNPNDANFPCRALGVGYSSPFQARLDELIAHGKQRRLLATETEEVDRLLARADQLTLVKTRARYTLRHQQAGVTGS